MATPAPLTGDLRDVLSQDFEPRSAVVTITTNLPKGAGVRDKTRKILHLPGGRIPVAADGTFTVDLTPTNAPDLDVSGLQYRIQISATQLGGGDSRRGGKLSWDSGFFNFTGAANIADLDLDVPTLTASWRSTYKASVETAVNATAAVRIAEVNAAGTSAKAAIQADRNQVAADKADVAADRAYVEGIVVTDLGTTDGQTKALIESPTSETAGALNAAIGAQAADPTATLGGQVRRVRNIAGPGIDLTGATNSATAFKAFIESAADGDTLVGVPGATYRLDWTGALATLVNKTRVQIDLSACTITSSTLVTPFSPMFVLNACRGIGVRVGRYIDAPITNLLVDLSKKGHSLVYCINSCRDIDVDYYAENLRDGVRLGNYALGSEGHSRGIRVKARGSKIGYPIACYLSEDVTVDIDVDDIHRGGYFGGVIGARGTIRFKNQHGADTVALLSDSLVSGTDAAAEANPYGARTISRGCEDIDLTVIDKGSTVYATPTMLAGILSSRADAVTHRNIRVKVLTTADGETSRGVGGFRIKSFVEGIFPRYAGENWHPDTLIDDVTISGLIDHSRAGTGTTGAALLVEAGVTGEPVAPTLQDFKTNDLRILKRPGLDESQILVSAPKAAGVFRMSGLNAPGINGIWKVVGAPTTFESTRMRALDLTQVSPQSVATIGSATSIDSVTGVLDNMGGTIGGARAAVRTKIINQTLTGQSSVTIAAGIPGKIVLLGVTGTVTTAITNAPGWRVGVTGTLSRFGAGSGLTVGSTSGPFDASAVVTMAYQDAAQDLVVSSTGAYFATGAVRLAIHYLDFSAPSSV